MTLVKVQPDKAYVIEESFIRFTLDYDKSPESAWREVRDLLLQDIAFKQEFRDWTFIPVVPRQKRFGANGPCCPAMALAKPGTVLAVEYEKSALQADADDAHNSGDVADFEGRRLFVEGKIDWHAKMHFWVPALFINPDEIRESMAASLYSNPHLSGSQTVRELAKKWQIPTTS